MALNEDPLLEEKITTQPTAENAQKLLFFLLGNSSLLAFNIIINAIDIYIHLTHRIDMGTLLNRTYNIPNAITALILCIFKPTNYKISIISALSALAIIMALLPILMLVHIKESIVFWTSLIIIGIIGAICSLVFSSTFSLASQFGPIAGAMASSGCGCCGVLASVLRIITKAAARTEAATKYSNAAYFFFAAAIIAGTLFYFIFKTRNPEVRAKMIPSSNGESAAISTRGTIDVIKAIWVSWLSVFSNFLITLSIFPGYVAQTAEPKSIGDWTPVIVVTLFCVFDWVGRAGPGWFIWPKRKFAWIPIALRFAFYPIFIIAIQKRISLDPWWTFVFMIPFAISNGYFGTIQIIYGSNPEELTLEQRKFAGFLMSFSVNAGILCAMGLTFVLPTPPPY